MNEEELMSLLADATNTPPPARLLDAAYASRSWAEIDAELAALVDDSADLAAAGVRSSDTKRRMVFESSIGVADVELDSDNRQLVVRVEPASRVTVDYVKGSTGARTVDEPVSTATFDDLASGPARLIIDSEFGQWRSGWFTL